ncbi:MAG: cadherin-like domain-containing protein, partial [Lewinella sp.]|nr:cadherin-like domain-containing protein [Lewinella sp.]
MKCKLTPFAIRIVVLSMLFLLAIPVAGLAQSPAGIPYPWNRISLTDYHMKPGIGWPLQDVTPEGGLPLWVPVGAGLVGGGVIIWLLTDGDNPSGTPLELRADAANSTCGQTVMVNVLTNDAGEGLTLVNVSTISGATVNWTSSGQVTIANATTLGTFNLTVTVEDNQGQTATSTLAVTIQPAALTLTDDEFTTASGVPATGNVLANDAGVNVQVTDVGTTADGEVTITATGNLTFTPAPGFSGTTTFTYTVADQCGQEAMATVTINVQPPGCSFTTTVTSTPADCGL